MRYMKWTRVILPVVFEEFELICIFFFVIFFVNFFVSISLHEPCTVLTFCVTFHLVS